jgi:hypothetical protein
MYYPIQFQPQIRKSHPGKGRYEQAKSDWDVCHPGRAWAEKCQGVPANKEIRLYRPRDGDKRLSAGK